MGNAVRCLLREQTAARFAALSPTRGALQLLLPLLLGGKFFTSRASERFWFRACSAAVQMLMSRRAEGVADANFARGNSGEFCHCSRAARVCIIRRGD